jgi:hypothetical protein
MIKRKLDIQNNIPKHYKALGLGYQHFVDQPQLEAMYQTHASLSDDLRLREECSWIFK